MSHEERRQRKVRMKGNGRARGGVKECHKTYQRHRGHKIPFETGEVFQSIDVHAEHAGEESERQEDEGDPAEAPQ